MPAASFRLRIPAWLIGALSLLIATACSVRPCREGTLLLEIVLADGAEATKVDVAADYGAAMLRATLTKPLTGTARFEIDFPTTAKYDSRNTISFVVDVTYSDGHHDLVSKADLALKNECTTFRFDLSTPTAMDLEARDTPPNDGDEPKDLHVITEPDGGGDAATTADAQTTSDGGAPPDDLSAIVDMRPVVNKRGIATSTVPSAAFSPGVGWWYNYGNTHSPADMGIEFVPMTYGASSLSVPLEAGTDYVLGFNEPNFKSQSNLTAAQAAANWPTLETLAGSRLIGSPAVNYCGPSTDCNGTDPYQYLTDFFAACTGCRVDFIAVHWYNCDFPSMQDYLEPGGNMPGFEQFGKPIWLTEFSCDPSATPAAQETFMRAAVPYLEASPHIFRYAWISNASTPNGQLMTGDGTPTALGNVYKSLAH